MEWNDEKVLKLIKLYSAKEVLWNSQHNDHKFRRKRFDALNELASELCIEVPEIERKIKNLTSHYYREKKRIESSNKTSSGTDEVYHSKWFAYTSLNFLQNRNKPTGKIHTKTLEKHKKLPENSTLQQIKRSKKDQNDDMTSEAISIMKFMRTVSEQQSQGFEKDEDALFGNYIAGQLRKMDRSTKAIVRHRISSIIFEAETGYRADMIPDLARLSSSDSHQEYYATSVLEQPAASPSTNYSMSSVHSADTNPDTVDPPKPLIPPASSPPVVGEAVAQNFRNNSKDIKITITPLDTANKER